MKTSFPPPLPAPFVWDKLPPNGIVCNQGASQVPPNKSLDIPSFWNWRVHYQLGEIYWRMGDWAKAEENLRRAVELHGKFPRIHLLLINALAGQEKYAELLAAMETFLKLFRMIASRHRSFGSATCCGRSWPSNPPLRKKSSRRCAPRTLYLNVEPL